MKCERGETTTTVLIAPLAMLLVFVVVQAALVFHAQAVVDAAAQEGAQAGQGELGTTSAVLAAVQSVTESNVGNLLSDIDVSVLARQSRLLVTVQAKGKSLIPGFVPTITSTAAGPREVFLPENRR